MKTLSAPTLAALAGPKVGIVQLVHMAFSTTPISLNMSTWDLTWLGVTYKGIRAGHHISHTRQARRDCRHQLGIIGR